MEDRTSSESPTSPGNSTLLKNGRWKLLVILALIVTGLILSIWQPVELADLLAYGRQMGDRPWFILTVIVVMALLFTFGLPGTLCMWLIAPFNPPWLATLILLTGSLLGAMGARFVGSKLRKGWKPGRIGGSVMGLLEKRSDLLTQTALRVLPGFPHSIINFAGGVLRLPLGIYMLAALIGLSVKWAVYSSAAHGATEALETGEPMSPSMLIPLIILTGLLLVGSWVKYRVQKQH